MFLGERPAHFAIMVVGVVACVWAITSSCAKVMEAEYKYKIERDKSFWHRSDK